MLTRLKLTLSNFFKSYKHYNYAKRKEEKEAQDGNTQAEKTLAQKPSQEEEIALLT